MQSAHEEVQRRGLEEEPIEEVAPTVPGKRARQIADDRAKKLQNDRSLKHGEDRDNEPSKH